jgi:FlaA1/EpsC-like NDP-sugar epimerase
MSKVFNHYYAWRLPVCGGIEFFLISGAVMLAAVIRFSTGELGPRHGLPFVLHAFLIAFVCLIFMYYAELYNPRLALSSRQLLFKLLQSFGMATVALMAIFYILPQLFVGRGVFLLGLTMAFWCVMGWRRLYRWLHARHQFRINVLIIGSGEEAEHVARSLLSGSPLGYEVKGFIGDSNDLGKDIL